MPHLKDTKIYTNEFAISKITGLSLDDTFNVAAEYNQVTEPSLEDVKDVIAQEVVNGDYAETDLHALVVLKDSTFGYFGGRCDTTGFDCQSWFESHASHDFETLIRTYVPQNVRRALGFPLEEDNVPAR